MKEQLGLSDELSIWGFENDTIIFDDASLGFGLALAPLDVTTLSDDSVNDVKSQISQFLNGLPSGIDLQFVCDIESGNEARLAKHIETVASSKNPIAAKLTTERVEKLRALDREGRIPLHKLYLFVRKPMATKLVEKQKLLSKKKRYEEVSEERLASELSRLSSLQDQIIQGLSQLGLSPKTLSSHEIMQLLYAQWNPGRENELGTYDPSDIRGSLLLTDFGLYDRGFLIGDTQHRIVSLKIMPDQTFSAMARVLQNLPFGSRLFLTIHVPDQTKEIESLQTNRRIAFSMARGKKSGVSDIESEAKLQDLETLLEQMIAQGEKVFRVGLGVLLRSRDEKVLADRVAETIETIRTMSGAEAMEETLASYFIFRDMALPNARQKERARRMKTSNLSDLIPIYGPWEGMANPRVLLRSQDGSLFSFDPFDPDLTNANQLVSGGSGAGKSFFANLLLLQMLKENPKVFFVDIGGSYKKLTENLGGQYVALGLKGGLSINPFDLKEGERVPPPEKIKFLLGLVELMTKEENSRGLPRLERSIIEEAIQTAYKTCDTPRLSNLRDLLLENPDPLIKRYGKILGGWCGETPYGAFLDQKTSVTISNPIITFDLKGLESYPDLQAVCLFIITDLVWREVQRDIQAMKFLVFDECWKLLKDEAGLVFIEEVFRTFRKYRASAIAISQDIDDFAKSKIASAILPNCSLKWLLMQPQADGARLAEVLNLNPNEVDLIKGLYQEKGRFSQAFLLAQKKSGVVVVEAGPLEYWLSTTDPADLGELEKERGIKPEISGLDLLSELSRRFPQGVARSRIGGGK